MTDKITYKYHVSITTTNTILTPEGYVMENQWITDYFNKTYMAGLPLFPSCEEIAQRAVDYFVNLFDEHKDLQLHNLIEVYVRIEGSPISFIEAIWAVAKR